MRVGVIYLLTDIQLAARLVVSLYSLRRWYYGPVTVFSTRPASHAIVRRCVTDRNLLVSHKQCKERPGHGYTAAYLTKTAILAQSPYQATVYLDADTVVNAELSELFAEAQSVPLVATNLCGWNTMMQSRAALVQQWRILQGDAALRSYNLEERLDRLLSYRCPLINSGVFAFQRVPRIIERWDSLTWAARDLPLPDEISLQLILFETPHTVLGSQFNCHPISWHGAVEAKIWHFFGCSHLTRGHCEEIWLPVYNECQRKRVAGIDKWSRLRFRRPQVSRR